MPVQPPLSPTSPVAVHEPLAGRAGVTSALIPTPVGHNHASFLAEAPNGDLLCAWFGGTHEGRPDVSIYLSRLPAGSERWENAVQVSDDADRSEQNPVIWFPDEDTIEILYTAQLFGSQDTAVVRRRRSDDSGRTWTTATELFPEPGLFIRQRPIRLANGDVLLPLFRCTVVAGRAWKGDADTSLVARSADGGESWSLSEVPGSTGLVHMDILPTARPDGLVGLFRSRWADAVHRSESLDGGATWSAPVATDLPNNNSSIQAARLDDGRYVLAYNHVNAETAPPAPVADDATKIVAPGEAVELERDAVWGVRRVPLDLAVSDDEGRNWRRVAVLEAGSDDAGRPLWSGLPDEAEMSYPSVVVRDGRLWVSYSYDRIAVKAVSLDMAVLDA